MTRPAKYLAVVGNEPTGPGPAYDPAFCDLIKALAQDGKFPESWCAAIGVHTATFYKWANLHPEFEEAVRVSWVLLLDHWTRKAEKAVIAGLVNGPVLVHILKSRFPSIYGKFPKGTIEHFENRNLPPEDQPVQVGVDGKVLATKEQLVERINALMARRRAETE